MQELQGIEVQAGGLQAVGGDGLDSGDDGTEESEEEASGGGVVVSVGCEADANDDGYEGEVGLQGIVTVENDAVDCDDEDRGGSSQDLVKGDGDESARVGVSDILTGK